MGKNYRFGLNQLLVLTSVIFLAPALRIYPAASSAAAGGCAWVSALVAYPVLLLFLLPLCDFMRRRADGEGLAGLLLRAGGPVFGRVFLIISALWLLLYGAFSLRAGANRLITTIYPSASPLFFSVTMGLMGLVAALGSTRALARLAKLTAPSVFGVLLLVLIFACFSIDPANLSAITVYDLPQIGLGTLPAIDVTAGALVFICFAEGPCIKKPGRLRHFALLTLALLLLLFILSVAIIGNFGAELTALLTRPFFSLARNLVFFGSIERVEALVVSLWVFPDLLILACVLTGAQQCLRLCFGFPADYSGERLPDIKEGRFIIWLCAAAAMVCGALLWKKPETLLRWSLETIPAINLSYSFGLIPLVYAVGRLSKKI